MKKKLLLVLLITILLSGSVFARENKHESGNMLLGINLGTSLTPNFFNSAKAFTGSDGLPVGTYALALDFGLTFDYYLSSWLSLNTGAIMHTGAYIFWDTLHLGYTGKDILNFTKWPICVTIPIMAHVNLLQFIYLGAGVNLNFPVSSWGFIDAAPGFDPKGKFFIGIPIDLGFDFVKPGKGGSRFFFRVTPEFHPNGTPLLVGFIWQLYNFKLK